tara:strand:+ start:7838 stop:8914 length:1077 start_codon:yes stop_codon:yes gene_type:complete
MIHYKMDTYNISDSMSQGNQIGEGARSVGERENRQEQSNLLSAVSIQNQDKLGEDETIGRSTVSDASSAIATPDGIASLSRGIAEAGGYKQLVSKDIANIGEAGKSVGRGAVRAGQNVADAYSSLGSNFTPGGSAAVTSAEELGQANFSRMAGPAGEGTTRALRGTGIATTNESTFGSAVADAGRDIESAGTSVGEVASSGVKNFQNLGEAGGVSRYLLRNVGGVTTELGLEAGSKAVGAIGGLVSAEQDISNVIETGHAFTKAQDSWARAGNVGSMVGAGLDIASVFLPALAPFALAENLISAGVSTYGGIKDDEATSSADATGVKDASNTGGDPVSSGWSQLGMVASQHTSANPAG